jgi:ankyrin repeat protein
LVKGADVDVPARNEFRQRPIHSAVAAGSLPITQLLIDYGAKVDAVQTQSVTALHAAARNGRKDLVDCLLSAGAERNAAMDNGKKPIDLAREQDHRAIVDRLSARW